MDIGYKGYTIVTGSERDDTSGRWNGRYRIIDDKGIVVYKNKNKPEKDQTQADESANVEARAWIDRKAAA